MTRRRVAGIMAALVTISVSVAACSSSTSATTSAQSTPAASAAGLSATTARGLEAAQAAVAAAEKTPAALAITPLSKAPPRGKTIAFVTCPLPTCALFQRGVQQGAGHLGWKVTVVPGGIGPQDQVLGWTQAVQDKPDGIIGVMELPESALQVPLSLAKSAGIPIVTIASDQDPSGAVISTLISPTWLASAMRPVADWTIADSSGKASIVLVTDPTNAAFASGVKSFGAEIAKNCPDCQLTQLSVSTADIGTKIPGEVVSYLQSHPNVKYVAAILGEILVGVPQAAATAGISGIKYVSRAAGTSNTEDIAHGMESASLGEEVTDAAYRGLDVLARKFVGDNFNRCCSDPQLESQLIVKSNDMSPNSPWAVPNALQSYLKAWGIS